MRLIIGLEPSIAVVEKLSLAQQALESPARQLGLDMVWTDAADIRLVLRVVDGATSDWSATLRDHLGTVLRSRRKILWDTWGVDWVDGAVRPALLVARAGVATEDSDVPSLQKQIDALVERSGARPSRTGWKPLIRLGRGRSEGPVDMSGVLTRYESLSWGRTASSHLVIWSTDVRADVVRTRVVDRIPLGG